VGSGGAKDSKKNILQVKGAGGENLEYCAMGGGEEVGGLKKTRRKGKRKQGPGGTK